MYWLDSDVVPVFPFETAPDILKARVEWGQDPSVKEALQAVINVYRRGVFWCNAQLMAIWTGLLDPELYFTFPITRSVRMQKRRRIAEYCVEVGKLASYSLCCYEEKLVTYAKAFERKSMEHPTMASLYHGTTHLAEVVDARLNSPGPVCISAKLVVAVSEIPEDVQTGVTEAGNIWMSG
jgi:hypothetical protein